MTKPIQQKFVCHLIPGEMGSILYEDQNGKNVGRLETEFLDDVLTVHFHSPSRCEAGKCAKPVVRIRNGNKEPMEELTLKDLADKAAAQEKPYAKRFRTKDEERDDAANAAFLEMLESLFGKGNVRQMPPID